MAKVKGMAATKYIGSLGPQVFYMRNGQNIVREKAASVRNPKTASQMNQRVKIANVVALYRANRDWMEKWAFAQRPEKWSLYNAYVSENLAKSVISLTKKENEYRVGIVEPLTFTKGTLPTIGLVFVSGNQFESSITVNDSTSLATVGALSREIVQNNSAWQEGDQLSMIVMKQKMATVAYEPGIGGTPIPVIKPIVETSVAELTLNFNDDTPIEDTDFELVLAVSAYYKMTFTPSANQLDGNEVAIGVMVCQSRKSGGTVLVSTQAPVLNNYDTFNTYASAEQRAKARASYGGESTIPFLVPEIPAEGDTPVDMPVELNNFNFPISVTTLSENQASIVLTNGMTGTAGAAYLKEHLTFRTSEGGTVSINSEEVAGTTRYFLADGADEFNQLDPGLTPGLYVFGDAAQGPTLAAAMWDGVQFDPAV